MNKTGLALIAALIIFAGCTSWEDTVTVQKSDLRYFKKTYRDCRVNFLAHAQKTAARYDFAVRGSFTVPGPEKDLVMDYVYVPATKRMERLLIFTAGLHGIEGYTGNAVLDHFFTEVFPSLNCDNTGVIVFHAVNPYGMKHFWRFTGENIDLNRNCGDAKLFTIKNAGYAKMRGTLEPEGKASAGFFSSAILTMKMAWYNLTMSRKEIMEAVVCGQYEYPKGIYYGGKKQAPQIAEMTRILSGIMARYRIAAHIDLHTGYGRRGYLHVIVPPVDDKKKSIIESLFPGHPIDWSSDKDFYQNSGDLNVYLGGLVKGIPVLPVTFEYGTLDSQSLTGGMKSLRTIILGNQGIQHGYAGEGDRRDIQAMVMEMFYPQSPAWRSEVIRQSRETFAKFFKRWNQLQRRDF